MIWPMLTVAAILTAGAVSALAETPTQLRDLIRKGIDGFKREDERRGDYLFTARNERNELDASGKVTSTHSHVWERIEVEGFPFARTIERDGKPVTAEERKTENGAMQKRLFELKTMTASAVAAGAARPTSQRDDWYEEFPEALDYTMVGEETINGRPTYHLEAVPRPGYQVRSVRARVLLKLKASIWIDKETSNLVKADAEIFDAVNVGFGVIGSVEKGTRIKMQRRLMADGNWLIESQSLRIAARILVFKTLRSESTTVWSDFRRRSKNVAAKQ